MISRRQYAIYLYLCVVKMGIYLPFDLCVHICKFVDDLRINKGKSNYAKRRRAKLIGRCHRCYRVKPGFYFTTRCDGKTCYPNISYNVKVAAFIEGVTSVIPD
uniref:RNA silencing suppressor n=1 Tax=papaya mottle-associated virus TaxID=3071214 RepID=A0A6G7S6S6_9VIRU|nr:Nucleic acid binding protein [papaya mottle-associated virus]